MNHPIPRKTRIINNNMDLPAPEFRRLLHQLRDILIIQHITRHRDGLAARLVDLIRDILRLLYPTAIESAYRPSPEKEK